MRTTYKGYTLELDFSGNDIYVKTKVIELNIIFDDISKAKKYIDTL